MGNGAGGPPTFKDSVSFFIPRSSLSSYGEGYIAIYVILRMPGHFPCFARSEKFSNFLDVPPPYLELILRHRKQTENKWRGNHERNDKQGK